MKGALLGRGGELPLVLEVASEVSRDTQQDRTRSEWSLKSNQRGARGTIPPCGRKQARDNNNEIIGCTRGGRLVW